MAGVLFSSDLETYTNNQQITGWANAGGAGLQAFTTSGFGRSAVSGTVGYGRASQGDAAVYTASGAIGNQAIRTDHKDVDSTTGAFFVGHLLRSTADSNTRYDTSVQSNGTALRVSISSYASGGTSLASSGYVFTCVATDTVHFESQAVGNVIEARIWKNSETRPSTPTVTATSSLITTGFPGLINSSTGNVVAFADNIVVTDTTVSAGVFDAAPDTTAPTLASAIVSNGAATTLALTMSEAMDSGFVPATSAFTVSGHTVSAVSISGSVISLTVSAFTNGETSKTVSYTQPGTNNARDLAGNLLANFASQPVTNNVAATDTIAPTFVSALVANALPANIVITMSETLGTFTPAAAAFAVSGGKTVSSVARSGALVTVTVTPAYAFGDTITVTYTKPGSNMLQDPSGNQTASFGPVAVSNNISSGAVVTITSPAAGGKRAPDGAYRASVPCNVTALDKTTHTVLERKTGLVSPVSGPFVFTSSVLTAGTERLFLVKADADDKDLGVFFATPV